MKKRRSQIGLRGIREDSYPGLPEELKEFNYYYEDCGHVIMTVPESLLKYAESNGDDDLDMYECPVPCKYVLEIGYRMYENHVICDVRYDKKLGIDLEEEWFEY